MDDSHSPWWLVVLLGIGVIGLAVWQASRFKLQVRVGAALLAMLYLAFVAFSIGGDPRGVATWRSWNTKDYLFILQGTVSLLAAVALIGRPHPRGQAVWFGLMSLTNASLCVGGKSIGMALPLALMGVGCGLYLFREYWCGRPLQGSDLWPQPLPESDEESPGAVWLVGGTGLVVSVLVIGTIHYALRVESSRATPTRRLSALPSPARIRSLLTLPATDTRTASQLGRAISQRTDIIVLLSALAFITFSAAAAKRSAAPPLEALLAAESGLDNLESETPTIDTVE